MAKEKQQEQEIMTDHKKVGAAISKARYWWAVLYPENMIPNWEDEIDDLLQVPFAYCVHDKDTDSMSEHRKDHVHLIIAFTNTTTYKHALGVFKLLGENAVNHCQAVISIRHAYDYLIHNTKSCEKAGKHLYDTSCRIAGNNFDIGSYEQVSQERRNEILRGMIDFIVDNALPDLTTFYVEYPEMADPLHFDVYKSYGALLERMCKGNHHRLKLRSSK